MPSAFRARRAPASANDPNPVYQDGSWKIFESPRVFPRSWLVHESRIEPDDAKIFNAVNHGDVDLHKIALLSTPLPANIAAGPEPSTDSASVRSYAANRIAAAVHTQTNALLVFSELYYPGWYAAVNGKKAEIYRANGALRSVVVPAGDSTVELHYRPWPVYVGALLSVAAFAGTLLAFLFLRRQQ